MKGSLLHDAFAHHAWATLHHGTDHRSQICTALTSMGIEPPEIGVWEYAATVGRAVDVPIGS